VAKDRVADKVVVMDKVKVVTVETDTNIVTAVLVRTKATASRLNKSGSILEMRLPESMTSNFQFSLLPVKKAT
jgi:ABC-type molybdate transport system ATPase subunit